MGLAEAAAPARLHTLVISDVPGDDPALIASGPTFPCNSAAADALGLIDRYHLNIPDELRHYLGAQPDRSCNGPCNDHTMIASPAQALRAAAEEAKKAGITPLILGDAIEGESKELGRTMAGIARSIRSLNEPVRAPAMLISGGETTVTIGPHGAGRGGRNTEFLLSLAIALDGDAGIYALAGDSDGIDGTEDAAGAFISPDTLSRAQSVGLMPKDFLDRHDSYSLFDALGDLIRTGPTLTNVNDIRLVMVTNEATGNAT